MNSSSLKTTFDTPFHTQVEPDFQIMRLGSGAMPQVLDLLIKGQAHLSAAESHFLKPQTLHDLRTHIRNGFPIVGIIEQNSGTVAAVALLTPAEKADWGKNMENYPAHLMQSGTAVIQSVCVDPQFKERGLMKKLLKGAEQIAHDENMFYMLAKVSTQNKNSAKGFLRSEFVPVAKKQDEKLGYNAAYWEKKLGDLALTNIPVFNGVYGSNPASSATVIAFAPAQR